jgi:HAD superfamily hydrolase (TIGR01509 family)
VSCRAVIFDFNGTLSDDEPVLYRIYAELFAEHGRPLPEPDYYDRLAGHSDAEIVRRWLGDRDDSEAVVNRRVTRYRELVSDGSTITPRVRQAVATAAARVPVAIVSGASAAEIRPVVAAAGLAAAFTTVVSSDDVHHAKPHPEGYQIALRRLEERAPGLRPDEVTVLEDTEPGVAAARAAGMRCIAVGRTLAPDRLAAADEVVAGVDRALIERILA